MTCARGIQAPVAARQLEQLLDRQRHRPVTVAPIIVGAPRLAVRMGWQRHGSLAVLERLRL